MVRICGGKGQQGKRIAEIISSYVDNKTIYVEAMCGMLGVHRHLAPLAKKCYCNDLGLDLILMWEAVKTFTLVLPMVDKARYEYLKNSGPSAERGLVGYGCSYGGCWFRSYIDNCIEQQYNSAIKLAPVLQTTEFTNGDFYPFLQLFRYTVEKTVIYLDPPYMNTDCSAYRHVGKFDRTKFDEIVDQLLDNPNITIFLSEYTDPPKWSQKWEITQRSNFGKRTEYLYLLNNK